MKFRENSPVSDFSKRNESIGLQHAELNVKGDVDGAQVVLNVNENDQGLGVNEPGPLSPSPSELMPNGVLQTWKTETGTVKLAEQLQAHKRGPL
jgi:hypothetical protein